MLNLYIIYNTSAFTIKNELSSTSPYIQTTESKKE